MAPRKVQHRREDPDQPLDELLQARGEGRHDLVDRHMDCGCNKLKGVINCESIELRVVKRAELSVNEPNGVRKLQESCVILCLLAWELSLHRDVRWVGKGRS